MATAPIYAATPNSARSRLTVGNSARDGTGTIVDGLVAGASGSILMRLVAHAEVQTTQGKLRIFTHDGTSWKIFDEIDVPATAAPSSAQSAWHYTYIFYDCVLKSGWKIGYAMNNGEAMIVVTFGGDY